MKLKEIIEWIIFSIKWILMRKHSVKAGIKSCKGDRYRLLQLKNNLYLCYYKRYSGHWVARSFISMMDKELYETET